MAGRKRSSGGSSADQESAATSKETSVDVVLDRLEAVVGELEGGDLSLQGALERFEEGVALARRGEHLLASVEQRVEALLAERDETVPLDVEDGLAPEENEHDDL